MIWAGFEGAWRPPHPEPGEEFTGFAHPPILSDVGDLKTTTPDVTGGFAPVTQLNL